MKYYAYCPQCPNYFQTATSVHDAKTHLEAHEKEYHKKKPVGTFGKGNTYPKNILTIDKNM